MKVYSTFIIYCLIFFFPYSYSHSQKESFRNPFDFPILLSGNFGELRANHFHSGIDFKTQGVEGKPVMAVQDGYISRIGVSPWGYGNVLYMNHPDGTTTVYAHLQRFIKPITLYVKEQQYWEESFAVDLYPDSSLFAFKQGDIIGYGGNSGSSGGPHLHFEVRDTETEEVLDPLIYYKDRIKDTQPPRITGLRVYPVEGRGVVNGSDRPRSLKLSASKNSKQPTLIDKIEAWGEIAFSVRAFDYMDGTSNIYGVKEVILMKDSDVVFRSNIMRYSFDETRYLNSFTDYAEWRRSGSFFMKSMIDPGNKLRFIEGKNRGIITIDEERTYLLSYLLSDLYGNTTLLAFKVQGKRQELPQINDSIRFNWSGDNRFGAKGVRLFIPRGNLYSNLTLRYRCEEDTIALAATHTLHEEAIPLHKSADLSIRLQHDTLSNKRQYGIVRLHKGRTYWIGGNYREGWIDGNIRELATYSLAADTQPPVITPIDPDNWVKKQRITFRISDKLSGVDTFRGEIDGEYVLFEFDGKKGLVHYKFDSERLTRGAHDLTFKVVDACGNKSVYTRKFVW